MTLPPCDQPPDDEPEDPSRREFLIGSAGAVIVAPLLAGAAETAAPKSEPERLQITTVCQIRMVVRQIASGGPSNQHRGPSNHHQWSIQRTRRPSNHDWWSIQSTPGSIKSSPVVYPMNTSSIKSRLVIYPINTAIHQIITSGLSNQHRGPSNQHRGPSNRDRGPSNRSIRRRV